MPDPGLTIEPDIVSVEPGGQARAVVTIANAGTIVEGYRLRVVDETSDTAVGPGSVRSWCRIIPPEGAEASADGSVVVSVYPQQQQSVVLVFAPETGPQVPSGRLAFGVHAASVVDASSSSVVEGEVEIGRVFGLQAKLAPVTSMGRWRGRHVVTLSNWGNTPARLRVVPSDPDQALGFLVRPEHLELPVGGTLSCRLKVRTRRPTLRGQSTRLPFTVVAEPELPPSGTAVQGGSSGVVAPSVTLPVGPGFSSPERPMVDGAFTQKPILSRGVVGVSALAALALVAGVALAWQKSPQERAAEAVPGVPLTPVMAAAVGTSPSEIMLSWEPVPDVTGYALQVVDPGSSKVVDTAELDAALGAHVVPDLKANTAYCFRLIAQRGDVPSPPSEQQCAKTKGASSTPATSPSGTGTGTGGPGGTPTTPAATPSPSVSGSASTGVSPPGSFAAGDWIAWVYVLPLAAPGAEQRATELRDSLAPRGVPAGLLASADFPLMRPALPQSSMVVYVGPFGSAAQATAECQKAKDDQPPIEDCLVAQPVP